MSATAAFCGHCGVPLAATVLSDTSAVPAEMLVESLDGGPSAEKPLTGAHHLAAEAHDGAVFPGPHRSARVRSLPVLVGIVGLAVVAVVIALGVAWHWHAASPLTPLTFPVSGPGGVAASIEEHGDLSCVWDETPDDLAHMYRLDCAEAKPADATRESNRQMEWGCAPGIYGIVYPTELNETGNLSLSVGLVLSKACPDGSQPHLTVWYRSNVVLFSSSAALDSIALAVLGPSARPITPVDWAKRQAQQSTQVTDPNFGAGGCAGLAIASASVGLEQSRNGQVSADVGSVLTASDAAMATLVGHLNESEYTRVNTALRNYLTRVVEQGQPPLSQQSTLGIYLDCGEPVPWQQSASQASSTPTAPQASATEATPTASESTAGLPKFTVWCNPPGDPPLVLFKPDTFEYSGCSSADIISSLKWKSWTATTAHATGVLTIVDWSGSGAAATLPQIEVPVDVILDEPIRASCGNFLTRATVRFTGAVPKGVPKDYPTVMTYTPAC